VVMSDVVDLKSALVRSAGHPRHAHAQAGRGSHTRPHPPLTGRPA
jgi:hypothetical protein